MSTYEAQRLENIKRNQALLDDLGIARKELEKTKRQPATKRQKFIPSEPTRSSARIASAPIKPSYDENKNDQTPRPTKRIKTSRTTAVAVKDEEDEEDTSSTPKRDLDSLEQQWYHWSPSAEPPTRDENGTFHFTSHPEFTPNKSPLEILQEGAFGGSYYRPVRSRTLGTVIEGDWKQLPSEWLETLNVETHLARPVYEPEANKFGVKCGQSIEEWEASGWINVEWDVRGWFQWYERFFRGRRGEDDDRQVGRWQRCVGERGRWRRALVKAYQKRGVRNVADEGTEEEEISPVLCQTCLHWAWEMRQDYLDLVWEGEV